MKKFVKVLSLMVSVLMLFASLGAMNVVAGADESGEFVVNGDFENGMNSWSIFNGTNTDVDTATNAALNGTKGLDVRAKSDGSYAAAYQVISGLVPGKSYTLSFYAKNAVTCVPNSGKVVGYDAGLRMTLRGNSINGAPAILVPYYADNQVWKRYKTSFTAPTADFDETTPVYLAYYVHSCTAGEWYIDNVSIYETAASTNLAPNGDLEEYTGSGFTGWQRFDNRGEFGINYFADTDIKYEGAASLKIISHDGTDPNFPTATGSDLRYGFKAAMTQGKTYKVSFKVRASSTAVKWWAKNYQGEYEINGTLPTANEWYEKVYYFKAAATGSWGILFGIYGATPHGTVWYDDVKLTEQTTSEINLGYDVTSNSPTGNPMVTTLASNIGKAVNNSTIQAVGRLTSPVTEAVLILGLYTESDGVKKLERVAFSTSIGTAMPKVQASLAIPATGSYEVRALLWNSLTEMQNLSKAVVWK